MPRIHVRTSCAAQPSEPAATSAHAHVDAWAYASGTRENAAYVPAITSSAHAHDSASACDEGHRRATSSAPAHERK